MPSVPVYNAPQVQLNPISGVQEKSIASPELLGAPGAQMQKLGTAAQGAGNNLNEIAVDMQRRENATAVFNAEAMLGQDYTQFDVAARQTRGVTAAGLTKKANEWWDKNATKYADTLTTDAQRELFGKSVTQLRMRSVSSVSQHEAEQQFVAVSEGAKASAMNEIDFAASHASDPAVVFGAKNRGLQRIAAGSALNGDGRETTAIKQAEYLDNFHKQVIQQLADGPTPQDAKVYFELNKGEIRGSSLDGINSMLKTATALSTAQTVSDKLSIEGQSEAAGLEFIRANYEGEDEKQAVAEWTTRWNQKRSAREGAQKDAADAAFDTYARTKRLSSIPPSVLNAMDGKTRLALEEHAREAASGESTKTDFGVYYDLRTLATTDPKTFAGVDLRQYVNKVSGSDLKGLIELQSKAAKGPLTDVATFDQQLSAQHNALGWGEGDKEQKGAFDQAVRNAVDAEQKRIGKELSYQERQVLIDRMTIDGKIKNSGIIRDTRGKLYEFQDTEEVRDFVPNIPKTERVKIEAALRRSGLTVSDAEVMRLYKQKYRLP